MITTTYREAIRAAIREALTKDARVFLMGEDVGRYGGAYGGSKGLLAQVGNCLDATAHFRCSRHFIFRAG